METTKLCRDMNKLRELQKQVADVNNSICERMRRLDEALPDLVMTKPEPPEQTYMVVDTEAGSSGNYFCDNAGWKNSPGCFRPGLSFAKAIRKADTHVAWVVAPCRPDTRWAVVAWDKRGQAIRAYMLEFNSAFRRVLYMSSRLPLGEEDKRLHGRCLNDALELRTQILACHDPNLADVHIVCLDMMENELR